MKKTRAGLLMVGLILWTGGAAAAESCAPVHSAMNRFRPAEFSAPLIWKSPIGGKDIQVFTDGIVLDDRSVIAGGYHAPAEKDEDTQPYLARVETHGKIVWEKRGEGKSPDRIVRLSKIGEEIVTLNAATAEKSALPFIRVMRYDQGGNNLGGFAISEGDGRLMPVALAPAKDGGYYIAARYENIKLTRQRFGVVYKTDKDGNRIWRRAYIPGLMTSLDDMIVLRNGDLLLAGTLTNEAGAQSGWMVRTDSEGGMKWQQTYPRGRAGALLRLDEMPGQDGYIAGGVLWPVAGERTGAWLLQVDPAGHVVWERFYNGADDYRVADLSVLGDGRVAALIGAVPVAGVQEGQYAHARVLALSPRGELLDADSYAEGNGLWPARMLDAGGRPLVIGRMREIPPEPPAPSAGEDKPAPPPVSYDGWVGELQGFAAYDDPCAAR